MYPGLTGLHKLGGHDLGLLNITIYGLGFLNGRVQQIPRRAYALLSIALDTPLYVSLCYSSIKAV